MLRVTELKAGKNGAKNAAEYLAAYYEQDQKHLPVGKWIGAAAEALGLNETGRDLKNDIEAVVSGIDPNTGEKLTKGQGKRLGYDLTFSSEKYVSVLAATASPELLKQIGEAHQKAVEETLAVGLPLVMGRMGKGGKYHERADVPVRLVHHFDNRNGDPNLHTHALLPNACRVGDKWLTIEAAEILEAQQALGAIFREKEAQAMEALGFTVEHKREVGQGERATGEVWHSVAGMPDEVVNHFSSRRKEIVEYADANGISYDKAAQATRAHKTEAKNSASAVIDTAQDWLSANGYELKGDALKGMAREREAFTPRNRAEVLETLHAHESRFSAWDWIKAEAKEGRVYDSKEQALDVLIDGRDCLRLPDDQFISQAQYKLEASITAAALARKHETRHRLEPEAVATAIKEHQQKNGFQLSAGQRSAVEHVCGGGGVSLIVGWAGTGKTVIAGAYMSAFEAAGYDIVSTSTATKAANNLQRETERKAANMAQLIHGLDEGKTRLTDKSVVVIDEAGMVSAADFAAVQRHVDAAGAKLIAIGDEKQLQPVGAGSPFRDLLAELMPATLEDIRRQKHEAERAISVDFYRGKSGAQIVEAALVEDYSNNPAPAADKLIIAHTHSDATTINATIRGKRHEAGELGEERAVNVWAGGGKAKTETLFAVGDRIRFTANERAKVKQYVNGEAGEVVAWGKDTIRIRVESDEPSRHGKEIELATTAGKPLDIAHGYAQTLASAQGLGVASVYYLPGAEIDRNSALVGHTRTKEAFHMYAAEGDREKIAAGVDEWRFKLSARELVAAAGVGVGVADTRAQQAHALTQAQEQQQEQARGAQRAAMEAQEQERAAVAALGAYAARCWEKARVDDYEPGRRGKAEQQAIGWVRAQADKLFPAPKPTPQEMDAALKPEASHPARCYWERDEQQKKAAAALVAADGALVTANEELEKIAPEIARGKKLSDFASNQREGQEKAHRVASAREGYLFGCEWPDGSLCLSGSELMGKQRAAAQQFLESGKWGFWNKPTTEKMAQCAELREARAAEQRRAARAEKAEKEAKEIQARNAPTIAIATNALKAQGVAQEDLTFTTKQQAQAWRMVVDSVPRLKAHEERIKSLTLEALKEPRQQQQKRDQVKAHEQQQDQARQAVYERENPQQEHSRGYGMSM
jgi:conjugative relaxase-like TrwC/TraI family protein